MSTFDEIAAKQGWNADSRETVLKSYIDSDMSLDLGAFAQNVADEENGVSEGSSGKRVPDFEKDVTGQSFGGAYWSQEEYRITITTLGTGEDCGLVVEDSSGHVINSVTISAVEADGIFKVADTDHSLAVYDDDWTIPAGIERSVHWDVGDTQPRLDQRHQIRLDESDIDEIAAWLRFALGIDEWDWSDGNDTWEF